MTSASIVISVASVLSWHYAPMTWVPTCTAGWDLVLLALIREEADDFPWAYCP